MCDQRWAPACTLLPDHHSALVCGGYSYANGGCVSTADIFDESSKRFTKCSSRLHYPRDFAVATPLSNGKVLISGGFNDVFGSLSIAELFDPENHRFSLVDQHMLSPRELHTATLLSDGTVLIVGGLDLTKRRTQCTAEIYNSSTNTFTHTRGNLKDDRFGHAACRLADGRILIVGGTSVYFGRGGYAKVLASAELYDPVTGMFLPTSSPMALARDRPTATLLADGSVLIEGGQGANGAPVFKSEIYNPVFNQFTEVQDSQGVARMAHNTSELPNGIVLITGGWSSPLKATTASVELFDQQTNMFKPASPLPFSSHDAAQVVFPDGFVLVAGGKTVEGIEAGGVNSAAWARP